MDKIFWDELAEQEENIELDKLLNEMGVPQFRWRDWSWLERNLLFNDPPLSGRALGIVQTKLKRRGEGKV
jgi:hypothetical protein